MLSLNYLLMTILIIISLSIGVYIGYIINKKKTSNEIINNIKIDNDKENGCSEKIYDATDINIRQSIIIKMEKLKEEINSDFISLAIYDVMSNEIRWRLALGATNTRYKRIVIRLGKGIAGEVVQLNRTVKIENYPHDVLGKPLEYPILLVEYLKSAIAVPVSNNQRIYGVLLLGQRETRKYTVEEELQIKHISNDIAKELSIANLYNTILNESYTNEENKNLYEYINDSLFVRFLEGQKYLLKQKERGELNFEVLDQSIVEFADDVQTMLINNVEEILKITNNDKKDKVLISIARDESSLLVEITANVSIPNTKEIFAGVYRRLGEIGGSVITYHDREQLYFVMQLPIWNQKNTLI